MKAGLGKDKKSKAMIIIDDIRSLKRQLFSVDIHDFIEYNELAFCGRTSSSIYTFCPYCGRSVQIPVRQIDSENADRIRLKKTCSCDCRQGLRYINMNFAQRYLQAISDKKGTASDDEEKRIQEIIGRTDEMQKQAQAGAAMLLYDKDFEPDLDPYDREALSEEQRLDDWVIAGGGNPMDYDDCVDAFTDPFGFHDDFGGGDGFFDGFGDGWGGGE